MGQSSDSLHFDSVSLVKSVVENTRGIDDLPTRVLVVCVTHKQVLRRESVGLHVHLCICYIVNKR